MPGFGSGAFGRDAYGEYHWSRRVFYEYIPELYRLADEESGGLLEVFAESLRPSFDELRHRIRHLDTLRDPFQVRTQYDERYRIKLGPRLEIKGDLEQKGTNSRVDAIQRFIAPGGRFGLLDVGKELTVTGSTIEANNKVVTIASIVNSTTVLTYPLLQTDAGPLTWEIRPDVETPENYFTVEVHGGSVAALAPGYILNDGFADYTVVARRQFKPITTERPLLTEQEGVDGVFNPTTLYFSSGTISLTQRDVGKLISVAASTIPENNTRFEITEVISATTAAVEGPDGNPPTVDGGPLTWALLPFAELDILGTIEPRGTVQQSGIDLEITAAGSPATITSPTGAFSSEDVGKRLSIRGSSTPSNNTTLTILTVVTPNEVTLDGTLTVDAGPLTWELRRTTTIGDDYIEVSVRAPSLIRRLAKDFGIEIDTQDSEDRQRSWVKNVSRWIMQKGTAKAYQILGNISGFEVEVAPLYRIDASYLGTLPSSHILPVGESGPGRSGMDGTLPTIVGPVQFTSPTAFFSAKDVGSNIRITDAGILSNDGIYTIASVIDENTVEFRSGDTATFPEPNNGSLTWAVIRLYADVPPTLPNFDEFDSDLMEALIDGYPPQTTNYFGLDKFCWEDDFYSDVEVVVSSVTQISSGVFQVRVSDGPAQGPSSIIGSAEVIKDIDNWIIIDSSGAEYYIETMPVFDAGTYLFEINAAIGPAIGQAFLRYECVEDSKCGYCGASKVLIRLTAGTIASETGVAVERALDRALERMEAVTPAHVSLVTVFQQGLEMSLNITMSMEISEISTSIYIPKDAYFDEVPADILVADPTGYSSPYHYSGPEESDTPYTDLVLYVTVETP